ncbi:hypothetical protein [cf. Phormidesmis sp. LEGE 11477]|uniref:hypothetical protein n=1 Tax=cf. Phormidesmis sp. LEGE 11477 TaxID=1828680 RepID=UPI0018813F2E|nr:hypothetical protein [cf. Phormidesmis sp. LEGE 11477]MBE9061510.1 hypothetical protein [cf. Phormidesmis sp. LEGE 11477]
MIVLTSEEITQLTACLADYPDAIAALQEISDCDGDIEDAAISLALRAGQEPDTNDRWLASFSKRYRHIACQTQFRDALSAHQPGTLVNHLTQETDCPALLAAPVAIYIFKSGVDDFCHSFDYARVQSEGPA